MLAARTVELREELVQAEGRHFCSYTLAGLLANLSGDKPFEPKGTWPACTRPSAFPHAAHFASCQKYDSELFVLTLLVKVLPVPTLCPTT